MSHINSFTPPAEGITHYARLAAPLIELGLMERHVNTFVITLAGDALIATCQQIPAIKAKYGEMCKEAGEFAARAALLTSFVENPVLFLMCL